MFFNRAITKRMHGYSMTQAWRSVVTSCTHRLRRLAALVPRALLADVEFCKRTETVRTLHVNKGIQEFVMFYHFAFCGFSCSWYVQLLDVSSSVWYYPGKIRGKMPGLLAVDFCLPSEVWKRDSNEHTNKGTNDLKTSLVANRYIKYCGPFTYWRKFGGKYG